MKKAALYVRVSTHHQIDKDSLPFQRQELINYAKHALGITEYEIFEDAGYSGKNTDRPAFQNMMARIRLGEFTHLIVWKIDRISRNLLDFSSMYLELKNYNVAFISKNEQFDTSNAIGEAMLKIILVFAELERQMTSERVGKIMMNRATKGLWNGAPIPLGYRWDDEKKFPVIDEKEAETIVLIFDLYEKLTSSTNVSRRLNSNKVLTKRGGTWTSKTVTDIIRNPFYKGTYRYNYREPGRGKRKKQEDWIIVDDNHDAIVSKEKWDACNNIMSINANANKAMYRREAKVHIFSSIFKCLKCGKGFISKTDVKRLDGFQPSIYICYSRNNGLGCTVKSVSEVNAGPFIFKFISNIFKTSKNIKKYKNIDSFEKALLNGSPFKDVKGIDSSALNVLYNSMLKASGEIKYQANLDIDKPSVTSELEKQQLVNKKNKYERSLERLQYLYLYADDAMGDKEYINIKKDINEKLSEVKHELEEIENASKNAPAVDINFILKAGYYIMSNELNIEEDVDFKLMSKAIDKKILHDFINAIIKNVYVDSGIIHQIIFQNNLKLNFLYKKE